MREQDNSKLMQAYERLHEDYRYLENEYAVLKEQVARMQQLEKRLWICQLERERYKDEAAALRRKG